MVSDALRRFIFPFLVIQDEFEALVDGHLRLQFILPENDTYIGIAKSIPLLFGHFRQDIIVNDHIPRINFGKTGDHV